MNADEASMPRTPGLRHLLAFFLCALLAFHNLPAHRFANAGEHQQAQVHGSDFVLATSRGETPYRVDHGGNAPPPHRPVAISIHAPALGLVTAHILPRADAALTSSEFRQPPARDPPAA